MYNIQCAYDVNVHMYVYSTCIFLNIKLHLYLSYDSHPKRKPIETNRYQSGK